jgi:hypothetical protein
MRCEVCGMSGEVRHVRRQRVTPWLTVTAESLSSAPVTSSLPEPTVTAESHVVHEACMPKLREQWQNDDLAYAISDYLSGGDARSAPKLNARIARLIAEHRALWATQEGH